MTHPPELHEDFVDLLRTFLDENVEFVVVGAHAMAAHGVSRATGDLDVLVRPTIDNAARTFRALSTFGAPVHAHGVRQADFATEGSVYQMGLPPKRIDVLTSVSGVTFDEVWSDRTTVTAGELTIPVMGRSTLLANKRASGRPKDLVDVDLLTKK